MGVSLENPKPAELALTGVSARMRELLLNTTVGLMQGGQTPSVSDAAEAAGVSRATAYRYFPSQSALVEAVVDRALGPILEWDSDLQDAEERVNDLLESSNDRIVEFEATFKAALALSLGQSALRNARQPADGPIFRRGHRIDLLKKALAPLQGRLTEAQFSRLAKALSLTFGIEVVLVLRDIWNVEVKEMQEIVTWAARSMVRTALMEADQLSAAR